MSAEAAIEQVAGEKPAVQVVTEEEPLEPNEASEAEQNENEAFSHHGPIQSEDLVQKTADQACQTLLVNQDLEKRYEKIQEKLENDFNQGMPKQIKTDLVRVRSDIDGLTVKLFDVDQSNRQEVHHIVNLTIDYLEKMISLLPKANKVAPEIRDAYVVPFTNINSIKAEHQECLMQAAIEDVRNKELASKESSINIYKKLTQELQRMNVNLYTLQTTDVQRFINLRSKLLSDLERFNEDRMKGEDLTANIPQILNSVHTEIEKLLPGLQLSENYHSIME